MTKDEFANLQSGDIVQSAMGDGYMVIEKLEDHAIVVRTLDLTNLDEWTLVFKSFLSEPADRSADKMNDLDRARD